MMPKNEDFRDLVWVTKDNRKITLRDLQHSHLRNIVRLLERAAKDRRERLEIIDELFDMDMSYYSSPSKVYPRSGKRAGYDDLVRELKYRKRRHKERIMKQVPIW